MFCTSNLKLYIEQKVIYQSNHWYMYNSTGQHIVCVSIYSLVRLYKIRATSYPRISFETFLKKKNSNGKKNAFLDRNGEKSILDQCLDLKQCKNTWPWPQLNFSYRCPKHRILFCLFQKHLSTESPLGSFCAITNSI